MGSPGGAGAAAPLRNPPTPQIPNARTTPMNPVFRNDLGTRRRFWSSQGWEISTLEQIYSAQGKEERIEAGGKRRLSPALPHSALLGFLPPGSGPVPELPVPQALGLGRCRVRAHPVSQECGAPSPGTLGMSLWDELFGMSCLGSAFWAAPFPDPKSSTGWTQGRTLLLHPKLPNVFFPGFSCPIPLGKRDLGTGSTPAVPGAGGGPAGWTGRAGTCWDLALGFFSSSFQIPGQTLQNLGSCFGDGDKPSGGKGGDNPQGQ